MERTIAGYLPAPAQGEAAPRKQEKKQRSKQTKGFSSFYTRGEEIFNAVSHIVGGAFGLLVAVLGVLYAYPDASHVAAMLVFAASVVVLYTMSALYHFLPDPTSGNRTDVLTILLGCLALGLLQITVGYVLGAVNSFRKGRVGDAIFDSLTWVLFDLGLFFAVFDFLTEYFAIPVAAGVKSFFETMTLPGVVMLGVGLLTAMVTAGRKEKLAGKFTKGFGALYGIISLLSDILSYARLFGLMLSGMIIAQQFNGIGMQLIEAGSVGFVFGPVVMLIGHAFNLAMGVLGAYIHDCRLQYIEFFSKFYTGEGTLFAPLGSRLEYIQFKNEI